MKGCCSHVTEFSGFFSPKFRPKLLITDVLSFGPFIGLNG